MHSQRFLLFLRIFGAFLVPFRFVYDLLTVLAGTRKNDGPKLVNKLSPAREARRKIWNLLLKSIKKPTKTGLKHYSSCDFPTFRLLSFRVFAGKMEGAPPPHLCWASG